MMGDLKEMLHRYSQHGEFVPVDCSRGVLVRIKKSWGKVRRSGVIGVIPGKMQYNGM